MKILIGVVSKPLPDGAVSDFIDAPSHVKLVHDMLAEDLASGGSETKATPRMSGQDNA